MTDIELFHGALGSADHARRAQGATAKAPRRLIGQRIRELRTARGWSANELGRRAGVSITTVIRAETAAQTPRKLSFARIAEALGTTLEELARG